MSERPSLRPPGAPRLTDKFQDWRDFTERVRRWDVAATWEACVRRLEELQSVPAEQRTEAEERVRYALARWVEGHDVLRPAKSRQLPYADEDTL